METQSRGTGLALFLKSVFDHAEEVARRRGATQVDDDQVEPLAEGARGKVRQLHQDDYDPTHNAQDRLREEQYQKAIADRKAEAEKLDFANARLRDAKTAASRQPDPGPKPHTPLVVLACLIVTLAMSMAPTIHDLAPDVDDAMLAWLAAAAVGLAIGGAILASVFFGGLGPAGATARTVFLQGGLIGGVLVGVALGLVRMASAQDAAELVLAAGLTMLEIATVVIGERIARRLEGARNEWLRATQALALLESERAVRQAEVHEIEGGMRALDDLVAEHRAYLEDRAWRAFDIPSVEAAAVRSARDGYASGAAHNRGWILGSERACS